MHWKTTSRDLKIKKKKDWHVWWAWYPVKAKEENGIYHWVWLGRIYRRSAYYREYKFPGIRHTWEYALDDFELIKKP